MLKTFEKLVEIPGGSGFEEKVIEFMVAELKKKPSGCLCGSDGKCHRKNRKR